jgi:hypothetical protein
MSFNHATIMLSHVRFWALQPRKSSMTVCKLKSPLDLDLWQKPLLKLQSTGALFFQ